MYYISLIVIVLIFIWRIIVGFRKGMVQEITSLIAMVVGVFCLMIVLEAIGNYMNKEVGQLVKTIIVLIVVCLIYRLVHVLFTSLELISKLPIISWLDKLLGLVVGFGEAALIVGLLVFFLKKWGLSILT